MTDEANVDHIDIDAVERYLTCLQDEISAGVSAVDGKAGFLDVGKDELQRRMSDARLRQHRLAEIDADPARWSERGEDFAVTASEVENPAAFRYQEPQILLIRKTRFLSNFE